MFIHCSRSEDTFFATITAEDADGREASTPTLRMTYDDAQQIKSQMEQMLLDWHIEHDPHERADLVDEYREDRDQDLAFSSEPF